MSSRSDSPCQCSGTTARGERCRAWAIRGTEFCSAHSGKVGAPKGNKNRLVHGLYAKSGRKVESLDDAIGGLQEKLGNLLALMDVSADAEDMLKVFGLYAQGTSRLGRLLRDKRALDGDSTDSLFEMLGRAIEEVKTELGVDLEV